LIWINRLSAPDRPALFRPFLGLHAPMPSRIVTYAHRPKRAPRKKAQAAAITGPTIVTATSKRTHRQVAGVVASDEQAIIVTAKNPHPRGSLGDVPDMTPEEYQRRCDAADALFRELVRQATGKQ
jgi:hypothetical protein